jgi:flagellar basal-body rod protein FlgB
VRDMAFQLLRLRYMLDAVSQQLERYMDMVAERQKLVAANIANADTPGYRTRDIDFQFEFESLEPGEKPSIVEVKNLPVKNDGNDVSIDRESRLLAENDLRFRLAAAFLRGNFAQIKSAIEGAGDKS